VLLARVEQQLFTKLSNLELWRRKKYGRTFFYTISKTRSEVLLSCRDLVYNPWRTGKATAVARGNFGHNSLTDCCGLESQWRHHITKVATSQRSRATFLTALPQRATPYTLAHTNITPSLPHSNTYLCSSTFVVNIRHQHDNDRTLQAIYCNACHLVGHLVIT